MGQEDYETESRGDTRRRRVCCLTCVRDDPRATVTQLTVLSLEGAPFTGGTQQLHRVCDKLIGSFLFSLLGSMHFTSIGLPTRLYLVRPVVDVSDKYLSAVPIDQ